MSSPKKYLPLWLSLAVVLGIFIGTKFNFKDSSDKLFASSNSKKDKLNRLIDYIDYEYVDPVNTDSIVDVTVNEILGNLDPHSVYIPVSEYESNADDMRGNFVGIGISYYQYKDTIAVIRAIEGGPAERAGIRGGDRILTADEHALYGTTAHRDSVTKHLKGEVNTKVKLKYYRPSEDKIYTATVKRKEVPIISVDAAYKLNDTLGYIKINRFSETTYAEFKNAILSLKEEGVSRLVVDLRNNPGGYISAAEKIVDEFLEEGKLILITKNKSGDVKKSMATSQGEFEKDAFYVLINENSASASEIVAGALQDNDKGIIVGRRSYGKGLVQREMALGDGSAVRLTIARYYTPTGRSIQRPYVKGRETAYYRDYENRYANGELKHADSIVVADSLRFKTPKGKIVYGGGGIIPDVFVPKDTSLEGETIAYINRSGFLSYFIFEYLEKHRSEFENLTVEEFIAQYEVNDELISSFIDYARFREAQIDLSTHQNELKIAIKASIANQIYGPNANEMVLNAIDPMLQKVIKIEGDLAQKNEEALTLN